MFCSSHLPRVLVLLAGFWFGPAASAADTPWPEWLAGEWRRETPAGSVNVERWFPPQGNMMLGVSHTVRAGQTTSFEYLRIEYRATAGMCLIALPSGQAETIFLLERADPAAGEWLFANPEHDFPQHISYRRIDGRSMVATISGPNPGGGERRVEFRFERVSN